jgi:signal transduction histidine kinase
MRRRLSMQIYLAFVGIALLCIAVASVAAHLLHDDLPMHGLVQNAAAFLVEDLVSGDNGSAAGRAALQAALERRADRLGLRLALWDADRKLIAASGPGPRVARFPRQGPRWMRFGRGPGFIIPLDSAGWLFVGPRDHRHTGLLGRGLLVVLLLMATAAVGCFWLARRITRRLEDLQQGVEQWGSGALLEPVPVQGSDEVAELATSFNRAAEKIDSLLNQQKRVLAHVSHELRSPLARLRMALELLTSGEELAPERRSELRETSERDIRELDELVGDLLLATRLQTASREMARESIDLHALVSEQARLVGARVEGARLEIRGDGKMLRRMLRNLLENARRYGAGSEIEVRLQPLAGADSSPAGARITVADRGPGVDEQQREKIFEPFYRSRGHGETRDGGVGLGLSLVKQIAEAHGGRVRYLPRDGGGSLFEVELPGFAG